jgi:anti-sigma regulatory factor (Ser/Thr protein kinase)
MDLKQISGPVIMDIPTDPATLFLVRSLVERLTQRLDFTQGQIDRLVLAVDEACTNIIRHAYGSRNDGRIVLTFVVEPDHVEFRIRDFGTRADPQSFKSRDLAEVQPGGLGMHFMRSAMDEIRYESPPDGGTLLIMVKSRNPKEVQDP